MVGLSLSDRNTRRILDAMRQQPVPYENYILMQGFRPPKEPDFESISAKAKEYLGKFPEGRMKLQEMEARQIKNILDRIYQYEKGDFERGFEMFGLNMVTFDDLGDVPSALKQIVQS
jgi:hypothetical protein